MNVLITGYKGFIGKRIDGKPFVGDVRNIKELIGQSKKVDGIVHLAAVSNWRDCKNNPVKCVTTNILGLCNVLEVAKKRKIWVLFISTFQIRKNTLYGLTKLTGEELCRVYQNQGVKIKIMRLPIVYGPDDKSHKIVTKMISMLTDGRKVNIDTDDKFKSALERQFEVQPIETRKVISASSQAA